ncbi:MAG TPA: SLC13 family permease [Acidobacteriota bacterium]|nr:SLC13 family permease [Acidobacteriota bacterium]
MMEEEGPHIEGRFDSFRKRIGLFLGPLLGIVVYLLPLDLPSGEARRLLAVFVCVVAWWVTEPIPLAVTALFAAVSAVVLQIADIKKVLAPFSDPIIFLFMGSFFLARAMHVHGLDKQIAAAFLSNRHLRRSPLLLLAFLGALCAALSMWLSNSACAAMFYPIALGILGSLGPGMEKKLGPAVLLLIAYSASLGGLGTPVGTPPNLIGMAMLERFASVKISFLQWMSIGIPVFAAGYLAVLVLLKFFYPLKLGPQKTGEGSYEKVPFTSAQKRCLAVFGVTVALWLLPGFAAIFPEEGSIIKSLMATSMPEAVAAMTGAILLFFVPASGGKSEKLLTWGNAVKIDWGTILLFGGGISLGSMIFDTKLAQSLGESWLSMFGTPGLWEFTLVSIVMAVLLSEFSSNTASANILIPVIISVAQSAGISPVPPAVGATIACSMGFMLPVSTPPNAIVYGSGLVPMREMVRAGVCVDLVMIVLIFVLLRVLLPVYGFI